MRININGTTIQCLPGRLTEQPGIEAVIAFADSWLRPVGGQSEGIHEAGGERLRGACAHAAPLSLGKVARTDAFGLPNSTLFHCVVASPDNAEPTEVLVLKCCREAFTKANELGYRSVAVAPFAAGTSGSCANPAAILAALECIPVDHNNIGLVRIIIGEGVSYESYSHDVIREVSRLQHLQL